MSELESSKYDPPDLEKLRSDSFSVSSAAIDELKPAGFSVMGLYTRLDVTEEQEESGEREFTCCRRRLRTRPFETPSNKKEDEGDDSSSSSSSSENESEKEKEYETAMFIPDIGLVGGEFWHEYDEKAKQIREDRAVCIQSQENYEKLISHKRFCTSFEGIDYMETPTFGEQLIVNGIEASEIAIGDVFEIEGGHSPLLLEITSPRKPCSYMNQKHGTSYGKKGICHYTHHKHLAGWFARVLVAGELREGMKFIRKEHPNPKWTLTYTNMALYGEGTKLESKMNTASWNRDRNELEELVAIPQFAEYEWKVEARKQLLKLDGIDWKTIRRDKLDPQLAAPSMLSAALKYFKIV
jgi:MOSC domain-containing protein YiiM